MKKLSFNHNNKVWLCYSFNFNQSTTSEISWRTFINLQCCMACKKTAQCSPRFGLSPDDAAGAVRVHSSHSTNPSPNRWTFIHIHDVVIPREDGWLVHVTDDDSHRCGIFKWSQMRETSIRINVGGFYVECVNFPLLIVQELQRCRRSVRSNSKATITTNTLAVVLTEWFYLWLTDSRSVPGQSAPADWMNVQIKHLERETGGSLLETWFQTA